MAGVLHYRFGNKRNILDVADAADGTRASRGAMHAAGVEFDDSFLVGQSTEANGIIVGIIFRTFYHAQSCVQRVTPAFQEGEGIIKIIAAIIGADDDGALACSKGIGGRGASVLGAQIMIMKTGGHRCSNCRA